MSAKVRQSMATTGVFHKPVATREQAENEAKGCARLASRIAVPALHGQIALPDRQLLVYEDVFATGRCELLMGDVIALADRDPAAQLRLDRLVDGVCADLQAAAEETGKSVPLAECVPDLYLDPSWQPTGPLVPAPRPATYPAPHRYDPYPPGIG
ncbi:hypothetical protein ACFC0C_36765 [Streptomyces sp. NPDC056178]|uniref:hypothetical protein n=1 Tax=Streptomyces sp. NPDC056178 TaxID=3345735 RepID=UPI0035DEC9C8